MKFLKRLQVILQGVLELYSSSELSPVKVRKLDLYTPASASVRCKQLPARGMNLVESASKGQRQCQEKDAA